MADVQAINPADVASAPASTASGGFDPDAYLSSPVHQEDVQTGAHGVGDWAYGVPKTGWDMASPYVKDIAEFVIKHPVESAVVGSYVPGLNRLPLFKDVAGARQALTQKYFPKEKVVVPPEHEMQLSKDIAEHFTPEEMADYVQNKRLPERFKVPTEIPTETTNAVGGYEGRPGFGFTPNSGPPSGPVASAGPVSPQMTPQMGSATPAQGAPRPMPRPVMPQGAPQGMPTAAPAQQAAPTAENFLSRMTQMAKQYAPAATEYAGSVGKVVAPIARFMGSAPVLGAQLMAHSGELNTNEDRLLAEKHALEQRMLQNKHDAEWNKYVDAKIKGLGQ